MIVNPSANTLMMVEAIKLVLSVNNPGFRVYEIG